MEDEKKYARDIEETDEVLEAVETDPVEFWEEKQRELLTSVVDYSLSALADLVGDTINMSPSYQRRLRWDEARQSRLIESFLMNVPVPPVFLNEDDFGQYSVIDGKQRLTAIRSFLTGGLRLIGLTVFKDVGEGKTIDELPPKLQKVIRTRTILRAIIILRQSDPDVKFEVFQRLNTGGVRLNPQEIRNSAFPGPLNDAIINLSEHRLFHRLLGIKAKQKSAIWQEMRDAELVLRYFTFRENWRDFRGGMKRRMDHFMEENQRLSGPPLVSLRDEFIETLRVVEAGFDGIAFNRWMPTKGTWRKQVLASLYDAQMFSCRGRDLERMRAHREQIAEEMKQLFTDDEFRVAVDAATNTPSYFRARIQVLSDMLDRVVGR